MLCAVIAGCGQHALEEQEALAQVKELARQHIPADVSWKIDSATANEGGFDSVYHVATLEVASPSAAPLKTGWLAHMQLAPHERRRIKVWLLHQRTRGSVWSFRAHGLIDRE